MLRIEEFCFSWSGSASFSIVLNEHFIFPEAVSLVLIPSRPRKLAFSVFFRPRILLLSLSSTFSCRRLAVFDADHLGFFRPRAFLAGRCPSYVLSVLKGGKPPDSAAVLRRVWGRTLPVRCCERSTATGCSSLPLLGSSMLLKQQVFFGRFVWPRSPFRVDDHLLRRPRPLSFLFSSLLPRLTPFFLRVAFAVGGASSRRSSRHRQKMHDFSHLRKAFLIEAF